MRVAAIVMRHPVFMEDEGGHHLIREFASRAEAEAWVAAQAEEFYKPGDYWIADVPAYGVPDNRAGAIETVCEIAFAWAGENGFSDPEQATEVWDAAKLLRPDLEPKR